MRFAIAYVGDADMGDSVKTIWSSRRTIGRDEWKRSSVQTITPERFPIRIFSQGQIAALAGENQQALLQIIDDAAGVKARQEKLNEARETHSMRQEPGFGNLTASWTIVTASLSSGRTQGAS